MKKQTYTMLFGILIILLFPSYASAENKLCKVKTIEDVSKCKRLDILSIDLHSGYTQAQDITERACDFRSQVTRLEHTKIVNCQYVGFVRNLR